MSNVVVFDWDAHDDNEFIKEINRVTGEHWSALGMTTDHNSALNTLFFVLKVLLSRKKFDKIIFWQQKHGILFSYICSLLRLKKRNKTIVLTLIYKPESGLKGKLKKHLYNTAISSKYIDLFVCFAKNECSFYSDLFKQPLSKFQSIYLGKNDEFNNHDNCISSEDYILAAGRSNRDHEFLYNAIKDTNYKLYIIDRTCTLKSTDNITILKNISYGYELYEYIAHSRAVIIPLKNERISAGQTVIIQGLMFGKPVIATKSDGVTDYIKDQKDGFIIDKSKEELLKKLQILYSDEETYKTMSKNARDSYEDNFSYSAFGRQVGEVALCLNNSV